MSLNAHMNRLRPCLMLYYGRLIIGGIAAVVIAIVTATILGSNFCNCPPDDRYRCFLIPMASSDILCCSMAFIFGVAAAIQAPGTPNEVRFLCTRPMSRMAIQFYPLAISVAAMVLLPALSWAVLVGGMAVAHAHALVSLAAMAGPDVGRHYLAALSVGLAVYGPLAAQRWLLLNRSKAIRIVGGLTALMIPLPMILLSLMFSGSTFVSRLLLLPSKHSGLPYLPSTIGIAVHFAFAAAWICGTFFAMRAMEV